MAKQDSAIRAIEKTLHDHFRETGVEAEVIVEHGYRDNIHIRVVTAHFYGLTMPQRYDEVWPLVEALAPDMVFRVSLCVLLTPEEYRAAYGESLQAV